MPKQLPDGVYPVMLTPFTRDREIDFDALDLIIDWYVNAGVAGLFAISNSSEMFELSNEERLSIARRVVNRVNIPVVATGSFGGLIEEQAQFIERMAATGVDTVIINTAQIASENEDDRVWEKRLFELLELTDCPLGFYECPKPYHRLLPPDIVERAAETGRFLFFKDTCGEPDIIRAKIEAASGSPLKMFNANTPLLYRSLQEGAAGYSGIATNIYPELLVWLCSHYEDEGVRAAKLDHYMRLAWYAIKNKYPTSAKAFLRREGLDIQPICRVEEQDIGPSDEVTLEALSSITSEWRQKCDVADPFRSVTDI